MITAYRDAETKRKSRENGTVGLSRFGPRKDELFVPLDQLANID
jgi:hypothetical protein